MCTGKSLEENAAKSYQRPSLKLGVQGTSPFYTATTAHGLLTMTAVNVFSQKPLASSYASTKTLRALSLPHFSGDRLANRRQPIGVSPWPRRMMGSGTGVLYLNQWEVRCLLWFHGIKASSDYHWAPRGAPLSAWSVWGKLWHLEQLHPFQSMKGEPGADDMIWSCGPTFAYNYLIYFWFFLLHEPKIFFIYVSLNQVLSYL